MADPRMRELIDDWVRDQVRQAVGDLDAVSVRTVEDLCEDLQLAIRHGRWFLAATACGLLGELLYGAAGGGRYPGAGGGWRAPATGSATRSQTARWQASHESLRALRNGCGHPALVAPQSRQVGTSGLPHEELSTRIGEHKGWEAVALAVEESPAALRDERITAWALAILDTVGRLEVGSR